MYLLEQFHLVQFYLFGANTLHFGTSSAIVAPNGSGKSAVLDAMQIVLHGADQRAVALNAQSGGDKNGRSIREYCLGYYRDDEHVRNHATTYLTMVFRDDQDVLPVVSAGIALGASIDDPAIRIYGSYILPGVSLALDDHMELAGNDPLPASWPSFKVHVADLSKGTAHTPDFFDRQRGSDFVEALLFRLRPNGTRGIDHAAFSKALKNALNLKDVVDASAFVRERIVEARPIDLKSFRHQLDTFHALNQKVDSIIDRIRVADETLQLGHKTLRTRMRKASYIALAADYRRDQHMEAAEAAQATVEHAQRAFNEAVKAEERAQDISAVQTRHLSDLLRQSRDHPTLVSNENLVQERERRLTPLKKNLTGDLRRVATAFDAAAAAPIARSAWEQAASPWQQVLDTLYKRAGGDPLELDVGDAIAGLRRSAQVTPPLLTGIRQWAHQKEQRHLAAKRAFTVASAQADRAKEGKVVILDEVLTVQRILSEAGIASVPVCDLARVTDREWGAAIEAYLGANAYALLIEPGREDEAIRRFAVIPASYNPFVVRLVAPNSDALPDSHLPTDALARLIVGTDERAVAFIRARLGRLHKLDSATGRSQEGLTREGVLIKGGTIGRLRLGEEAVILNGGAEPKANRDALLRERDRLSQELVHADREDVAAQRVLEAIAPLEALAATVDNIERWLREHLDEESGLDLTLTLAQLRENPDLLALQTLIDEANLTDHRYKTLLKEATEARAVASNVVDTAKTRVRELEQSSAALAQAASDAMSQPHVDAGWIDETRTRLDSKEASLNERIDRCQERANDAAEKYGGLESDLRTAARAYMNLHSPDMALDPSLPDEVMVKLTEDVERLRHSELGNYKREAEEAYRTAVSTFRSRVAANLNSSFDDMIAQLRDLNSLMSRLPAFSNDERYHFRWWVNPDHEALHDFIVKVAQQSGEEDLLSDPIQVPDTFRRLLEGVDAESQGLLEDYRRFFSFDVEVRSEGKKVSTLGSRMVKGSGGEHRAPLFVVAGAALAAAYGKLAGDTTGLSLILFDELGDKIDDVNTKAVFDYLVSLGLQPIVAAPNDALAKINDSVEGYVELYRDADVLTVSHIGLGPDARELLSSDSWVKHPELLEAEIQRVRQEREAAP